MRMDDCSGSPFRRIPRILSGSRVLLRPFKATDSPLLYAAAQECLAELMDRFPNDVPQLATRAGARAYIALCRNNWRERSFLEYGIFLKRDEALLGDIALEANWESREFDLTFWLRPNARGKGFATEAASLATEFAFHSLGARSVEVGVDPDNHASCRVVERLGFCNTGTLEQAGYFAGTREGARFIYLVTATQWADSGSAVEGRTTSEGPTVNGSAQQP